jgi:hypothetical protein
MILDQASRLTRLLYEVPQVQSTAYRALPQPNSHPPVPLLIKRKLRIGCDRTFDHGTALSTYLDSPQSIQHHGRRHHPLDDRRTAAQPQDSEHTNISTSQSDTILFEINL